MNLNTPHRELLESVNQQLAATPSSTDYTMLLRWRVMSLSQYLLSCNDPALVSACANALTTFAVEGPGTRTNSSIKNAINRIKEVFGVSAVLPSITTESCDRVINEIESLARHGSDLIGRARSRLSVISGRIDTISTKYKYPGLSHRFRLLKDVINDSTRSEDELVRAAAAILYVEEINDVIPDSLGLIGLLDDDYAMRVVLRDLSHVDQRSVLHWSESIAALWDDLPFLQGVNLERGDNPIFVSWLDRVNSFTTYGHVLQESVKPLVLLQPSVACEPLHSLVSLIGLTILDAVTSSRTKSQTLVQGQTYEVDERFVRFEGIGGSREANWLCLKLRDCNVYEAPGIADRMIPVPPRRLSSEKEFRARPRAPGPDSLQRFFDWETSIGVVSISKPVLFVSSQRRTFELLERLESNGVRLLEHGLVRFVARDAARIDTRGTVILVAPSLEVARHVLSRDIELQAIVVDGFERLNSGRHSLPFLQGAGSPPIIVWATAGLYPEIVPSWMPPHDCLEASRDDVIDIAELDDPNPGRVYTALWEAATGMNVRVFEFSTTAAEVDIRNDIESLFAVLDESESLAEHWRYFLRRNARTLALLVDATPAEWVQIKAFASRFLQQHHAHVSSLRQRAADLIDPVTNGLRKVVDSINAVEDDFNSRGTALSVFAANPRFGEQHWVFPCHRSEQLAIVGSLIDKLGITTVAPRSMQDLDVGSNCVVTGWTSRSFARRLLAYTPGTIVALVDQKQQHLWCGASTVVRRLGGSIIDTIQGGPRQQSTILHASPKQIEQIPDHLERSSRYLGGESNRGETSDCIIAWLNGELEGKVLARGGRVLVEDGQVVREYPTSGLRVGHRVILGVGNTNRPPADEFTEILVNRLRAHQPETVEKAKEWRRALQNACQQTGWSLSTLQMKLESVGIKRHQATIAGWLAIDNAAPIAPHSVEADLDALVPLIGQHLRYELTQIKQACNYLRALKLSCSRALLRRWEGGKAEIEVDDTFLDSLVTQLRLQVRAYEVESLTRVELPSEMIGWWILPELAEHFDNNAVTELSDHFDDEDERSDLTT